MEDILNQLGLQQYYQVFKQKNFTPRTFIAIKNASGQSYQLRQTIMNSCGLSHYQVLAICDKAAEIYDKSNSYQLMAETMNVMPVQNGKRTPSSSKRIKQLLQTPTIKTSFDVFLQNQSKVPINHNQVKQNDYHKEQIKQQNPSKNPKRTLFTEEQNQNAVNNIKSQKEKSIKLEKSLRQDEPISIKQEPVEIKESEQIIAGDNNQQQQNQERNEEINQQSHQIDHISQKLELNFVPQPHYFQDGSPKQSVHIQEQVEDQQQQIMEINENLQQENNVSEIVQEDANIQEQYRDQQLQTVEEQMKMDEEQVIEKKAEQVINKSYGVDAWTQCEDLSKYLLTFNLQTQTQNVTMVDESTQVKFIDNNELIIEDSNMTIKFPEQKGSKLTEDFVQSQIKQSLQTQQSNSRPTSQTRDEKQSFIIFEPQAHKLKPPAINRFFEMTGLNTDTTASSKDTKIPSSQKDSLEPSYKRQKHQ